MATSYMMLIEAKSGVQPVIVPGLVFLAGFAEGEALGSGVLHSGGLGVGAWLRRDRW